MTDDVGQPGPSRAARRRGPVLPTALALVLLLGGGTAVAVGLSGPDSTPAPPALPTTTVEPPAADERPAPDPTTATEEPAAPAATEEPAAPAVPEEPTEAIAPVEAPVSVSIPAIGVDSDLLHLGLNPDTTLEVPEGPDFDTAAWYDGSPRPGEPGPAVILGHVSSAADGPSVFFELSLLEKGDTVEVAREDGTIATFEVYDLQQFPKDSFPTVQVYGSTPGPELRIITCGGTIAESTGHFSDNIIVFAREV